MSDHTGVVNGDCSPLRRRLILLCVALFLVGGAWQVHQALRVDRPGLPLADIVRAASQAPAPARPARPGLACAPRLQLSIVQLAAGPELLLDGNQLWQRHLQPALSRRPLLAPPTNVTVAALLHPPQPPRGLLRRLQRAAPSGQGAGPGASLRASLLEHGSQLLQLAHDTHQLAPPTADMYPAAVLVHITAVAGSSPAKKESSLDGGGSGSSGAGGPAGSPAFRPTLTAVPLEDEGGEALAVIITLPEGASWGGPGAQQAALEQLAGAIAGWLDAGVRPCVGPGGAGAGQTAGSGVGNACGAGEGGGAVQLAAACRAEAGTLLGRFAAALRVLPDMHVAPELAQLAVRAVRAAEAAREAAAQRQQQQQEAAPGEDHLRLAQQQQQQHVLRLSREAWAAVSAVSRHPGFGVEAVFPAEHQLAVVLPLALPMVLVVARAAARELQSWRLARRAAAVAARAKKVS